MTSTVSSSPDQNRTAVTGWFNVNADDWGRDRYTTDRILECVRGRSVSSASAMVFMEDSERGAALSQQHSVDVGLHLNFTLMFSVANCPAKLKEHLRTVSSFLSRGALTRAIYNPWLVRSFEYLVATQRDEFARLYGREPLRYDGHHHMHLSANVMLSELLPAGSIVRRHFSYEPGEKTLRNKAFRWFTDSRLTRRHSVVDFLYSLPPLAPPDRLSHIFSRGRDAVVELETHPVNPEEHRFLTSGEIFRWAGDCPIASGFRVRNFHAAA